jgi:predicted alpha/beta-hydrolase family hydrolase
MAPRTRTGVLLAPGAGAGRDQATLVALDDAFTAAGATVVRMDFPYRKAGRRGPDRAPVLLAAVEEEAVLLAQRCDRLILGGRSMGGRMCSMFAASSGSGSASEMAAKIAGLLLVSYPLHPPGRRERMRTEHFPSITVATLFVSGTRDAFATPEELLSATAAIPGPVTHHWIEGKDHALRGADARICALAREWSAAL